MNYLVIKIFAVGNADCLLFEMLDQELGVVDFCRRPSLSGHPLSPPNQCQPPKVIFICLTHPHSDHMTEMESILDFAAANNGEFWHTVYDMAKVLELYASPRVARAFRKPLIRELARLASLASAVAEKFPAERIRFISGRPGASERILSTEEIDIDVLGPSRRDTTEYILMLQRVNAGELREVNDRLINRTSAVLRIRYGENTIILGGDAPSENWRQITGRWQTDNPQPMGVQAVKASHHGSKDSFYPELWDGLFGEKPGIIFVSADGSIRPTREFLDSFAPRRERGIDDKIYCTGPMDRERRPEFLGLEYQAVLDFASQPVRDSGMVRWGNIEVTIPYKGPISVTQPYTSPV
ncbi:hypothetical protein FJZ31_31820 [Candidatus Poribacteria bacterium]|nr:hypothetical protein [Candidatus Poribacteria bacterium]